MTDRDRDGEEAVRRSYDARAADYERRWSGYLEASLRHTLEEMSMSPGDRLLDVGCGTGVLLARLLASEPEIEAAGADLSPKMLRQARRRLPDDVPLVEASATDLPFEDGAFEIVVSTSALHFFDAPVRALAEFHRLLTPDGRLVLTDWCTDFWTTWLVARSLRLLDPAHHRAYGTDELTALLQSAHFEIQKMRRYKIGPVWGLMSVVATRSPPA